jgi:hypothetical protein
VFNKWISDIPTNQYPTVISTTLGSEFNSKMFYDWLATKNIRLFYINKSDYKTTYATAIVDRFIRTIRSKLETFQESNNSKAVVTVMNDLVDNYNNTIHSTLGKPPNEMTMDDVIKNADTKREHNDNIMQKYSNKADGNIVGVLSKKISSTKDLK